MAKPRYPVTWNGRNLQQRRKTRAALIEVALARVKAIFQEHDPCVISMVVVDDVGISYGFTSHDPECEVASVSKPHLLASYATVDKALEEMSKKRMS